MRAHIRAPISSALWGSHLQMLDVEIQFVVVQESQVYKARLQYGRKTQTHADARPDVHHSESSSAHTNACTAVKKVGYLEGYPFSSFCVDIQVCCGTSDPLL